MCKAMGAIAITDRERWGKRGKERERDKKEEEKGGGESKEEKILFNT